MEKYMLNHLILVILKGLDLRGEALKFSFFTSILCFYILYFYNLKHKNTLYFYNLNNIVTISLSI